VEYRRGGKSFDGGAGGFAGFGQVEVSVADTDGLAHDSFNEQCAEAVIRGHANTIDAFPSALSDRFIRGAIGI
jgi:hypothetical protein